MKIGSTPKSPQAATALGARPHTLPFQASYVGQLDAPQPVTAQDPSLLLFTKATGTSAALGGPYQSTYPHLLDPATGFFEGRQKITAADGTLLVQLSGRAIPKLDAAGRAIDGEFKLTNMVGNVVGGTGKYENATGRFEGAGEASLVNLRVTASYAGKLTLSPPR